MINFVNDINRFFWFFFNILADKKYISKRIDSLAFIYKNLAKLPDMFAGN